jgi:hypothetical protein
MDKHRQRYIKFLRKVRFFINILTYKNFDTLKIKTIYFRDDQKVLS